MSADERRPAPQANNTAQRGDNGERRGRGGRLTPVSLFIVLLLLWFLSQIQFVLTLILLAILLGTLLEGPVRRLEERRVPRPAAITIMYVAILGGLVATGLVIVPVVQDQIGVFQDEVPQQLEELQADWAQSDSDLLSGPGAEILAQFNDFIEEPEIPTFFAPEAAADLAVPLLSSIALGVIGFVTLFVITFYYLLERALIRRVVVDQLRASVQPRVDRLWQEAELKLGSWLRGQLLLCVIIGVVSTVGYGIIGLPFWPLLGLWAGLTEIIPILGPWLGGIPAVVVALTQGWEIAVITLIFFLVMQQAENWFLVPRVMRGAVGLTPMTVFLAILAGTQVQGITGAILAIPIAAILQIVIADILASRRQQYEEETGERVSGWRWMLSRGVRDSSQAPDGGEGSDASQRESETRSPYRIEHEPEPIHNADMPERDGARRHPDDEQAPSDRRDTPTWRPGSRRGQERESDDDQPSWGELRRRRDDEPPSR